MRPTRPATVPRPTPTPLSDHGLGKWISTVVFLLLASLAISATIIPPAQAARSGLPSQSAGFRPLVLQRELAPLTTISVVQAPQVDLVEVQHEDEIRQEQGLPPRFALPHSVFVTPAISGTWEKLGALTEVWRLRISSPGALSLNLGFTRYFLPPEAALFVYDANDPDNGTRGFTAADNEEHGQLWTPVVLADDIVVELSVPSRLRPDVQLALTSINIGYRFFGERRQTEKSGACNIDVVCPQGDEWREEIQSVAAISTGGNIFCSGFMVNNTAEDETPYFMTANHCGLSEFNAASLVVYWNFFSPNCGDQGGGSLSENQTGANFLASYAPSDFTLVRLDDPPNPNWRVTYAGWNRTEADPTSAVAIHHPSGDEKSISFEFDPTSTTSYLQDAGPGDGTHIRVADWDAGTTEQGSSGSPLLDQNHRVVGQLHGGWAACNNDLPDWYGRLSVSWSGGGTTNTSLSSWLDPLATGVETLELLNPAALGLRITPVGNLSAAGDRGGPFTPANFSYTLANRSEQDIEYSVTVDQSWLTVSNPTGSLLAGGTAFVIVTINENAGVLGIGNYEATVSFENTTDHTGDTSRRIMLQVGIPQLIYAFPLDQDPGWLVQSGWAYGQPLGQGGADGQEGNYGFPDPTSGYTGTNVYGYNLAGNYTNDLPERHLTTTNIDCSNLSQVTLKFWRWLGVESPQYDHAAVSVSNDGVAYTTVWQNGSEITDNAWSLREYDISAVADGQSTVTIRWTLGPTDVSYVYCGWNVDDVEIWGLDNNSQPVFLTRFSATPEADGIAIRWSTHPSGDTGDFRLSGSRGPDEWEVPHSRLADGGYQAKDSSPELAAGGVVTYNLFYQVAAGEWILLGTETADLDSPPGRTRLIGARPNPFNPATSIHFDLARTAHVRLAVYDVRGRLVRVLKDEVMTPGRHLAVWEGLDGDGQAAGSGTYLYRFEAEGLVQDRKLSLIR